MIMSAPISRANEFVEKARQMTGENGFGWDNMGVYIQQIIQGSVCHLQFDCYTDPYTDSHKGDAPSFEKLYYDMSRAFFEMGGYFSRPYGGWTDMVYEKYGCSRKCYRVSAPWYRGPLLIKCYPAFYHYGVLCILCRLNG